MTAHDIADVFRLLTALGSFIAVVILAIKWKAWKYAPYSRRLLALGLFVYALATSIANITAIIQHIDPGIYVYLHLLATWFTVSGAYHLNVRKESVALDGNGKPIH